MAHKTSCDICGSDLTEASGQSSEGLILGTFHIPCRSEIQTAMYCFPLLPEGTQHFCSFACLESWLKKRRGQT